MSEALVQEPTVASKAQRAFFNRNDITLETQKCLLAIIDDVKGVGEIVCPLEKDINSGFLILSTKLKPMSPASDTSVVPYETAVKAILMPGDAIENENK